MTQAAGLMRSVVDQLPGHLDSLGIVIDTELDPLHTGLIGPEITDLVTTVGHLPAKRTASTPQMAALVTLLLHEAGVQSGDTLAVGSSGSFPGLLVATLAACQAMDVHARVMISLGASSYGATRPAFNLLHLYQWLRVQGLATDAPLAVSLGGDEDQATEFDPEIRTAITEQVRRSGLPLLDESVLEVNVAKRMALYGRVTAFVNCGGSWANLGRSPSVLSLKPGLNRKIPLPEKRDRGVIHQMAARDVPVIHLLHLAGLAARHGLVWDPASLSQVQAVRLRPSHGAVSGKRIALGALMALSCILLVTYRFSWFSSFIVNRRSPSCES